MGGSRARAWRRTEEMNRGGRCDRGGEKMKERTTQKAGAERMGGALEKHRRKGGVK